MANKKYDLLIFYMAEPMGLDWGGGWLVGGGVVEWMRWGWGLAGVPPIVTYKQFNILIFSFKLLLT